MKYNILINQKRAMELSLDIKEVAILEVISFAPNWATEVIIDKRKLYWIARQKIQRELPILNLKSDTIWRYLKTLEKKGMIFYETDKKRDLMRLTSLGMSLFTMSEKNSSTMSEKNPNHYVGKKSELPMSEKNPTYNTTNNNTTSDNNTLIPKIKDFEMLEKIYKHFHKLKKSQGYYPPNNKQQSIDTLEKVIRIDKLPLTELKALIGFAVNDDRDNFNWQKNLISLASLRSKSKSNGMKKWQNIHKDLITTGKKQVDKLNKDKEQQRIYEELNL